MNSRPGDVIALKVVDGASGEESSSTTRIVDSEFAPATNGEHDADKGFVLDRGFLENVVNHSDEYVEHLERLDWS